jgi:tRNA 2-thiouridine synthesizing protein A
MTVDVVVDARGLQCPMPVIKLSQAIMGAETGQTIELVSTDRGSCSDVPAWVADMGHVLKEQFETDGEFHFVIEKA